MSGCSVYTSRRLSGSLSRGQPKLVLTLRKITNGQTVKNARNSNFLLSNCCVPNLWTKTMATRATSFPALGYRTSSLFEDQLYSRVLHYLRTVVHFFVVLVGFQEWFYIPAGSLPYIRRVNSCILFSLEQSRVVDFMVAENHPDSMSESNVLSFEFSQLLLRRMNDCPRQFCQNSIVSCSINPMRVNESLCVWSLSHLARIGECDLCFFRLAL